MEYLHLKSSQSDRPEPLKNWLIEKFFAGVYFLRLDWFLRTALFHLSGSNAQRYEFPAPSNLVRRAKNWFGYGSKPWHHDLQPPEMGRMGHPSPSVLKPAKCPCWRRQTCTTMRFWWRVVVGAVCRSSRTPELVVWVVFSHLYWRKRCGTSNWGLAGHLLYI